VRCREGSLRVLYMAGGTIPDRGYFTLRVRESGARIGELDEEFVWERSVGDVFTFGLQQWVVLNIDHQNVEVAPVSTKVSMAPFWKADLNGRDFHLSEMIALFLEEMDGYENIEDAANHLSERYFLDEVSAARLIEYLVAQRQATGSGLPHRHRLLAEHIEGFEDRSDSRQVVLHAIWGGKVLTPYVIALGQAWEEQYGSTLKLYHDDDTILIALPAGEHTPPLREMLTMVTPENVERLLRKKLEQTGIFGALFRQNAARALLLPKRGFNRRTPLWLNRIRSRKLLQAIYEYEDFPVLTETWRSCLRDEFDMAHLKTLLRELEQDEIEIVETRSQSPSPFAAEIIHWQTHTHMYEDDTPGVLTESNLSDSILREAVFTSSLRPRVSKKLLDFFTERLTRTSRGYTPDSTDELYDWIHERILLPVDEVHTLVHAMKRDHGAEARQWLEALSDRVAEVTLPGSSCQSLVSLENLKPVLESLFIPGSDGEDMFFATLSQWLRYYGPIEESRLAEVWGVDHARLDAIIETMCQERSVVRDCFREGEERVEICDAENLERLLRMLRSRGRREFQPLPIRMLQVFLARHQGLIPNGLAEETPLQEKADRPVQIKELQDCVEMLFGYPAKASIWESDIFPARMKNYSAEQLDLLFQQSDLVWFGTGNERLSFCLGQDRMLYHEPEAPVDLEVKDIFPDLYGKYDYGDIQRTTGLDHTGLSERLWSLVWQGVVSNDRFEPVRRGSVSGYGASLEKPSGVSGHRMRYRINRWRVSHPLSGNWFLLNPDPVTTDLLDEEELARERVRQLLTRYGVIFRELLQQELPQFHWGAVFRSLRLMELSGEVLAGYFFEGVPGLQFTSHRAFQELLNPLPSDAVYWMNAADPASLCGVRPDVSDKDLPRRVSSNYLVFHGAHLMLTLGRSGRDVQVFAAPLDENLPLYLRIFHVLMNRHVNPLSQIMVEKINEEPALQSEYTSRFLEFGFAKGYRGLTLRRDYR
jgi:ATP-dependent Lhr-like helicase